MLRCVPRQSRLETSRALMIPRIDPGSFVGDQSGWQEIVRKR